MMRTDVRSSMLVLSLLAASTAGPSGAAATLSTPEWEKVLAADGAAMDYFGTGVSLQGSQLVVGAPYDDAAGTDSGSAYVFGRSTTGAWTLKQKLVPSTAGPYDNVGRHVLLDGDRLFVTASSDDDKGTDAGAVYVFQNTGVTWQEVSKLTASDGFPGETFGDSIAADGDRLLVGAPHDNQHGAFSGSAYMFERLPAGIWMETSKLVASDGAANDVFGADIAIQEDIAVITSFGDDDNGLDSGSVYVFCGTPSGAWLQHQKITPSDGGAGDWFGTSISIDDGSLVVGAFKDDDKAAEAGSAYVFRYDAQSVNARREPRRPEHRGSGSPPAWFRMRS